MKKILAILSVSLLLGGCQKTKDNINAALEFDLNYSSEVSVPASSIAVNVPVDFTTPEIATQSNEKFAAEGTAKDNIEEIKITKFTITNTTGNLDFMKSITVYIKTSDLGEAKLASKSNIPPGTTTLNLDVENTNLKEYLFRDKIMFRINVVGSNTAISAEQKLKLDETFRVKGKKIV